MYLKAVNLAALVLASLLVCATTAPAQSVIPQVVSPHVSAPGYVLAADDDGEEAKKPPRPKSEADRKNEEQAAALRAFIRDKVKGVMENDVMKDVRAVLPQMWEPLKLALVIIFLIAFVAFHFQRQKRAMLEAEQERALSPAEVEFGRDPDWRNKKET